MDSDRKTGAGVAGAHCNREGSLVQAIHILPLPVALAKAGQAEAKSNQHTGWPLLEAAACGLVFPLTRGNDEFLDAPFIMVRCWNMTDATRASAKLRPHLEKRPREKRGERAVIELFYAGHPRRSLLQERAGYVRNDFMYAKIVAATQNTIQAYLPTNPHPDLAPRVGRSC